MKYVSLPSVLNTGSRYAVSTSLKYIGLLGSPAFHSPSFAPTPVPPHWFMHFVEPLRWISHVPEVAPATNLSVTALLSVVEVK